MAKKRNAPRAPTPNRSSTTNTETETTTTTRRTKVSITFKDTTKSLEDILSGSRQKGDYDEGLEEFVQSEREYAEVDLTAGSFKGKKVSTAKQGFENAKKRLKDDAVGKNVRVVAQGDSIFLVREDLVGATEEAA